MRLCVAGLSPGLLRGVTRQTPTKEKTITRNRTQNTASQTREARAPAFIAWHVAEKGEKKSFWTRIGAAWDHKDGEGYSLQLDLVPVSGGRIVLRKPTDEAAHAEQQPVELAV